MAIRPGATGDAGPVIASTTSSRAIAAPVDPGCTCDVSQNKWGGRLDRVKGWLSSPLTHTDVIQMVKTTLAAVLAWVLAELVLGLEQAFLAPWVALLTVHVTLYRTLWRGIHTVAAVFIGILLSVILVEAFDTSVWSLGGALFIGLSLSRVKVLRDDDTTIATTAMVVIATSYGLTDQRAIELLPDRLFGTAIGVSVALLINTIVLAPLNDRSAQQQIDEVDRMLGQLLIDMARELREPEAHQDEDDWIDRTRSIDASLHRAWSLVHTAQESRSGNPRRRRHPNDYVETYPKLLMRLEEGVSQVRSIARHVRESNRESQEWDPRFRDRFITLLEEVGHRVARPDANVAAVRKDLQALAHDLSNENLSGLRWPLYGALIANLQIIVDVVDDVATTGSVRASAGR